MAGVLNRGGPGAGVNGLSPIEEYLDELRASLQVRGAARRRFLKECEHHLADAGVERSESETVRAFGAAVEIAAAFDTEVAARLGVRSTFATVAGVLATGGSTLALVHSASSGATGPMGWAVTFFVAAQLAGVSTALALLQALVLRRSTMSPTQIVLLARRNACALVAAGVTMFSAGAALPGRGPALLLLAGPALVCCATTRVLRARALGRRLGGSGALAVRPPPKDVGLLTRLSVPAIGTRRLLGITTCLAVAAAFVRDHGEHATISDALLTSGIEGTAVIGCFLVVGPALGLWHPRLRRRARPC